MCKLLIRLKVEISVDLPPFISETEEVKLLLSGLYMAFEHTLALRANLKFMRGRDSAV